MVASIRQALLKRIDLEGYCVASEILLNCQEVEQCFYSNKLYKLGVILNKANDKVEHKSLDDSIDEYVQMGWIDIHDAYSKADDYSRFRSLLINPPLDFTTF